MPVIINELEIVVESPPEVSSEAPPPATPASPPPAPLELNELLDRRVRLALRTLAH